MPCKHAALAAIYAKQMAEIDEPWKLWECREASGKHGDSWTQLSVHPAWWKNYEYRQIPKTITINGIEVPEPMREKPEVGVEYYYIDSSTRSGIHADFWHNLDTDYIRLKRGLCHLTRENCIIHAKSLFSFSEVG